MAEVLRLFTGVIFGLTVVVLGLTGVDVAVSGAFSFSESESSGTVSVACFLATGATSFSTSFWFSARILVRSERLFYS